MQFGCERCGYVENEAEAFARAGRRVACPRCGAGLVRMSLADAVALAREAAEAAAWRESATNGTRAQR